MRTSLLATLLVIAGGACGDDGAPDRDGAPTRDGALAADARPVDGDAMVAGTADATVPGPDDAMGPPPDAGPPPPDAEPTPIDAEPPPSPDAALAAPDAAPAGPLLSETFSLPDGAGWPAPWTVLGGVAEAVVDGGRGRLVPQVSGYTLGRLGVAGDHEEIDATLRMRFGEIGTQGIGFYARQNGGYLRVSALHGAGYAVFVEGFRGPRIGVWRELDGVEEELAATSLGAGGLLTGVDYRVRFRLTQADATQTRLQAKLWLATAAEPAAWSVDTTNDTPALQGIGGGFAVDAWNTRTPGSGGTPPPVWVDDVVVYAAD